MATETQIKAFIEKLGKLAVAESNKRIANGLPFVLPSVCIAQSALETGWGTSGLMTRANAYFGIKAGGSWTGKVYTAGTWEVADGEAYNTTANFRAYNTLAESVADYYDLITRLSRYSGALSEGLDGSQWKTPKQTITAIWAGGYATDTLYVEKIMSTINSRNLQQYDAMINGVSDFTYAHETMIFSNAEMVPGNLIITDSGRSVANDNSVKSAIAVNWDTAPVMSGDTDFTVEVPKNYIMYMVKLTGDKATFIGEVKNGSTIFFNAGDKVGYYLEHIDGINIELSTFKENVIFNSENLPDATAIFNTGIAQFVKVE